MRTITIQIDAALVANFDYYVSLDFRFSSRSQALRNLIEKYVEDQTEQERARHEVSSASNRQFRPNL
jgi:metal-responsive CopG/Arc/MetJ family transcriptional regulator